MKFIKKTFALLLVLALALNFCIPAFAASETGTIRIINADPNALYTVYRIFDLESYKGDAYSYKVRTENGWDAFANSIAYSDTNPDGLVSISNGYITPIYNQAPLQPADNEAWAAALIDKAKQWILSYAPPADGQGQTGTNDSEVLIPGLQLGYYFVNTTLGTVCSLDTLTKPSVTISEKNESPTVNKEVFDNDPAFQDRKRSDASVGDLVKFTATVPVKAGAVGYKLVDTMTQGLVFENDTHPLTVQVDGTLIPAAGSWALTGNTGDTEFSVAFEDAFIADQVGKDIIVTYYGKLTADAVNYDAATNSATIRYGENSELESVPSETITCTYNLSIIKYAEECGKNILLAGAQFTLSKSDTLIPPYDDDIIRMTGSGTSYIVDPDGPVDTITTTTDGFFTIQGLDAGIYYLHEIKSPDGYNKLTKPIRITIDHDGTVTYDDGNAVTDRTFQITQGTDTYPIEGVIPVLNQTGSALPSTGGIGTLVFYAAGALMMLFALVLLITRKKMSHRNTQD